MKYLTSSETIIVDRVRVKKQRSAGESIEVVVEKGRLKMEDSISAEGEPIQVEGFEIIQTIKRTFKGQDFLDIITSSNPEEEIYSKLGISVQ